MDFSQIISGIDAVDVVFTVLGTSTVVSEALPFMKEVKSNSTLQLCFNVLKMILNNFRVRK